ncbi:MAG: hypothetical protein QM703_05405 [Gemmatales bacterium]
MLLSSKQRDRRRGVILLVVLALITLFASIGVAFVYFAEAEATKAQDQKAGETVKLPDADLMLNYVLRQLIFPTQNNASALLPAEFAGEHVRANERQHGAECGALQRHGAIACANH